MISLLLRLGIAISFGEVNSPKLYEHGQIAENLYEGHGFAMHWPYTPIDSVRTELMKSPPQHEGAFLPPIHPYILYISYVIFGKGETAIVAMLILNALVSACIPLMTYVLTKELFNERAARVVSCIAMIFLPAIMAVVTFSGSVYYQLLVLINILYFFKIYQKGKLRNYIYAAITTGLMILLRSEYLILGFILFAVCFFSSIHINKFSHALLFVVIVVMIVGPWTYRNYQLFGAFVPVLSHPWYEIWRGNNEIATGTTTDADGRSIWVENSTFPNLIKSLDGLPYDKKFEVRADSIFRVDVLASWGAEPTKYAWLALKKAGYFFTIDVNNPSSRNQVYLLFSFGGWIVIVSSLVKLVRSRINRDHLFLFVFFGTFLLYYVGLTAATVMLPRYQIYVMVALMPIAGVLSNNLGKKIEGAL
jgi:hypothetical protein